MNEPNRSRILTPRSESFPRWYQEVIAKAELAENGPVRGTMVIRPYAYAIWERMRAAIDAGIKQAGAQNAYFPLLIPESYLAREAEHVEGFAPELAVVSVAGGKQLEEPLVVRPTSETIVGKYMAKWVQSHRDLPLLLNQWANVVRWELRPRLFLRTSEFLWQEGHTAHATREDAAAYARRIHLDVYARFLVEDLAVPVVVGLKTPRERFAGAVSTLTCEAMTGDGKALQMATSHELGTTFARAFGIGFTTAEGTRQPCWTTSWGSSTRMFGGLVMAHGDDAGLRVPPRVAEVQCVVLVVREEAARAARELQATLRSSGIRAVLDEAWGTGLGRRINDVELKGVPLRIEVGPRDLAQGVVTFVRRDTGAKDQVTLAVAPARALSVLHEVQQGLYAQALARQQRLTVDVSSLDEAVEASRSGFARLPWALVGEEGEARMAEDALGVRCLQRSDGSLPASDDESELVALIARAY
jgi:prolyl-tRNA synthetase